MDIINTNIEGFRVRRATEEDVPLIFKFICDLASYENLLHEVKSTEDILMQSIFVEHACKVVIAEFEEKPIGFALYFHNFSTFEGRPGLYLEDLYIEPQFRNRGFGKKLLQFLGYEAVRLNCKRFEWWCIDWNTPSIEFYKSLGAVPMDEWTVYRIDGEVLKQMAVDFEEE